MLNGYGLETAIKAFLALSPSEWNANRPGSAFM